MAERQIFGFSGVLAGGADGFRLIEHAVGLGRGPRVCHLPTAVGDDPAGNGVHDDFAEQPRRAVYRELVADGSLPPGYASEDGVGLHYVGTELHEAVTVRPEATAWWVDKDGHRRIPARMLQADSLR